MAAPMSLKIRPAIDGDLDLILHFIRALADYEKLSHEVKVDRDVLAAHLFGPAPKAEVLIGEIDGRPQGFALFFHNFSTFVGKPGIYLEDLFVTPAQRSKGFVNIVASFYIERTGLLPLIFDVNGLKYAVVLVLASRMLT